VVQELSFACHPLLIQIFSILRGISGKMVEKKEGNTMDCRNCGTLLTCREKHYKASGNFPEKTVLQWQNDDGAAHYSTKDGKNFTCNIPDDESKPIPKEQETLQSEQKLSQGESIPEIISLATLDARLKTIEGITQSILHIVADMKTEGVKICQE
jgi:hypothetical protein